MENTEILNLPYIMPSQAQKHVTHNEAIRKLDALIQLSVASMDASAPPSSPVAGVRYIIGENAAGDWLGLEGQVAAFLDGNWTVFEPLDGWLAYIEDRNIFVVRSSSSWQDLPAPRTLEDMESVSIGTEQDLNNKLSVSADATLFSCSERDHRFNINKAREIDTASIIFKSEWKGHAEIGLAGSNDFQVKVSNNGSNFQTAMQIDNATGKVEFPAGAKTISRIDFSGLWAANTVHDWMTFDEGKGAAGGNFNNSAGSASEPSFNLGQVGPFIRQGTRIRSFVATFRSNVNLITTFNLRLAYRYGLLEDGATNADLQTAVIFERDGIDVGTDFFSKLDEQLSDYECPKDGFLLMFVQPIGTHTRTRQLSSTTSIEIISA